MYAYPTKLKVKSEYAATNAPKIIKKTLNWISFDATFFKIIDSNIIVNKIENRLKHVIIGKFNNFVPPKPATTLKEDINAKGNITLNTLGEKGVILTLFIKAKLPRINTVVKNWINARKRTDGNP